MAKQPRKKPTQPKRLKLEALSNLSGKYNLPFSQGQKFTIDTKRAQELIQNEDAKEIK